MTAHIELQIERADVRSHEASVLIDHLTRELAERYADDGVGDFQIEDVLVPRSIFLIARWEGTAAACGAYRPISEHVAEIKRMYVVPAMRNRGLGRRILAALEEHARIEGYIFCRLETGTEQPEALHLYELAGYQRIAPYGYHKDDPRSVCFEKRL